MSLRGPSEYKVSSTGRHKDDGVCKEDKVRRRLLGQRGIIIDLKRLWWKRIV